MKIKPLLIIFYIGIMLYPAYMFYLALFLPVNAGVEEAMEYQNLLQTSLWVSWVLLVAISVYYKWTTEKNLFFMFTYVFIGLGFVLYGVYTHQVITEYNIETRFDDPSTFTFLIVFQNIVIATILTGFLQLAVWWFTRRLHRR